MTSIPKKPGIYAIQLNLLEASTINVGRLGKRLFPAAEYIYVGSAQGSGGLKARLERHLRREPKQFHWHIDYLRDIAEVSALCYFTIEKSKASSSMHFPGALLHESLECRWIQALIKLPGANPPVPGFGSSDCRLECPTHLVTFSHFHQNSGKNGPFLTRGCTRKILAEAIGIPVELLVWEVLAQAQYPWYVPYT